MNRCFFTPNDEICMKQTDSESIQTAIECAKQSGYNKIVIPRMNLRTNSEEWIIDEAILLPDEIQIVLDNCYLRQADGCFDNMFRNKNVYSNDMCSEKGQRNIRICGIGDAVLDGGLHNGLTEINSRKEGMPHIVVNNTILLHNVYDFVIENITIRNQRWWAINLLHVKHGHISNITFDAKNDVPNQDGIDIRLGCSDIIIENIYGRAGDDVVALSGFKGFEADLGFYMPQRNADIHNIIIRNVIATSSRAIIALRNHDEIGLYNISINDIFDIPDADADEYENKKPYAAIRIGQCLYSNVRSSLPGETHSINVSNVHSHCYYSIMINVSLENSMFENIYAEQGTKRVISTDTEWKGTQYGAKIKNVVFRNIFCNAFDNDVCVFEFTGNSDDYAQNIKAENVFAADGVKRIQADIQTEISEI